jgi:phosphonate transport system ATP-binding protein
MLEIANLYKKYPGTTAPAINRLNLTIEKGEFVGILGKSGAGKSTLIRCINRLVEPDQGRILWNGTNITRLHQRELLKVRCGIGMIFQQFNLIPRLDVLTNVMVGQFCTIPLWRSILGAFPPKDIEQGMEALRRVKIEHLAHKRVDELSGGQQQRVAIARVLMQKPKMILGDEPVASLDPVTSKTILDFIAELHQIEKITVILNLHDVALAQKYAKRIIGIADGEVVFDGRPDQLGEAELELIYPEESLVTN